jgi:hypothetical protein
MSDNKQRRAGFLIIVGFGVTVVGALIDLINVYGDGGYRFLQFSGLLQAFLSPLAAVAVTGAWWFLSKVPARETSQ